MATKHINIRVDEVLAESVEALAADKESRSAIYVRVLKSGLESITAQPEKVKSGCDGNENNLAATLKDEIEYLRRQIETKDEQISNLTTALLNSQKEVSNAQQLHGAEKAEKLLESGEVKEKHPWWKFWV
jgi:predicted RNase H-like nuclease (RuvC/YqgF family)